MTLLEPPHVPDPAAGLLAAMLAASPAGVAHLDAGARFLQVNARLAAVNDAPVAAHLGRSVREMAPQVADHVERMVAEVLATGQARLAVEFSGLDGSRWTTDWHPVRDPLTGACTSVLSLATEVERAGDTGDALRRTARTLQRSLLPTQVPSSEELDVAARYAPGTADDVGGDWYDVIPLGAGRIALVAAAVMGHLRTAARTCARLDLRPGEVLDVLDGVLRELDDDAIATCVYAVFDPHTREVRLASAGHLPPVARPAGGTATALAVSVSAPLGLRDPSRETAVRLHPGAVLAFYTDGLVHARGSDPDEGIARLCALLDAGPADLEQLCEELVLRGRPTGSRDDAALLVVRVPEDVDSRSRTVVVEVPRERALMFDVRGQARVAMRSWMLLDEVVDTATLLASELATNALVHGHGRVELRLRLTRDRLVLESVDSGQHMPRRRRAGDEDEGGRGLHLVAELADRWGFRATDEGKVVWAELDLA